MKYNQCYTPVFIVAIIHIKRNYFESRLQNSGIICPLSNSIGSGGWQPSGPFVLQRRVKPIDRKLRIPYPWWCKTKK